MESPFTPEIVGAVVNHMNTEHADDSLIISRSLGGVPDADKAKMVTVGPDGAEFLAIVGRQEKSITVPWKMEITERAHIREEIARMYHEGCEALGVDPRPGTEH